MIITNYQTLKASVLNTLKRTNDTEANDYFDQWLQRFELLARRRLGAAEQETLSTQTVSTEYVELPADLVAVKTLKAGTQPLAYITTTEADAQIAGGLTTTLYYTVEASRIRLVAPPAGNVILTLLYLASLGLSSTNPTTWLTNTHPDTYYYGVLAEAASDYEWSEMAALWGRERDVRLHDIIIDGHYGQHDHRRISAAGPVV